MTPSLEPLFAHIPSDTLTARPTFRSGFANSVNRQFYFSKNMEYF